MNLSLIYFSQTAELFEGPVYDVENNYLYFVSILDGLIYLYNPSTKEIISVKLDSPSSCVYVLDKKKILVASKNGFYKIDFETLKVTFEFQIDIDLKVRYNDGIKDPKDRFIIGTMGYPEIKKNVGNVYSYHSGSSKIIIRNTTISNGLAFSNDYKFLYFIDTPTKKVAKYYYDLETGDVEFKSYVIEFNNDSSPDGMTIDKNGMLWIAEWGGHSVSKWNPLTGMKLETITLPFKNVTSCCFDDKSNLYVTTAKNENDSDIFNGSGLFYIDLNKI